LPHFLVIIIRPRRSPSAAAYVIKLYRGRSVGLCIGRSVGARSVCPVHCGKRRIGSGCRLASPRHRSDGSRDEAGSDVWRLVYGKGYFGGEFRARLVMGTLRRTCATVPRCGLFP